LNTRYNTFSSTMRSQEFKDISISAVVLAISFGIAFAGGFRAFRNLQILGIFILISLIAVSLGFVLHEIGHRYVARKYGFFAEYKMWRIGLLIAFAGSLLGFIFAAPGAVNIYPRANGYNTAMTTSQKMGIISLTGPAMNFILAVVFLLLNFIYPHLLFSLGARINTWLAVFNLIPFGPLDGMKIYRWSWKVWFIAFIAGAGLYIIEYFAL
jgi:Zn-dependent protease